MIGGEEQCSCGKSCVPTMLTDSREESVHQAEVCAAVLRMRFAVKVCQVAFEQLTRRHRSSRRRLSRPNYSPRCGEGGPSISARQCTTPVSTALATKTTETMPSAVATRTSSHFQHARRATRRPGASQDPHLARILTVALRLLTAALRRGAAVRRRLSRGHTLLD
jgi:hypothetical protein